MQGLTKQNFWNALHAKFPDQVDLFCQWMDDWKKENLWHLLIQDGVKFHDLPFEMQVGILERFKIEMYNKMRGARPTHANDFVDAYKKGLQAFFSKSLHHFVARDNMIRG